MALSRRKLLISGASLGAVAVAGGATYELGKKETRARIVIAGGGAAGIGIANKLNMYLNGARITVIDARPYHWYQPGQTLLLAGSYTKRDDVISSNTEYLDSNISWVNDTVAEFKPDQNRVMTNKGEQIDYDYLIVATGVELRYDLIEGMDTDLIGKDGIASIYFSPEAGITSYKQAQQFARSGGGQGVFTRPNGAMKCAGAPMKATNLVEYFVRQAGNRDAFNIDYFTAENFLFSVKPFNKKISEIWNRRDISANYKHELKAIDNSAKKAWFNTDSGMVEQAWDFIHVVPPMSPVAVVRNSELADQTQFKGYLEVDQYSMQHKRYPNVFGLGDTVGTPIGKTAASVKSQLPVVAENITAMINDSEPSGRWGGYTSCPMILDVGHAMLWEFDYSMQPMTALPFEVVDPLEESKLAWVMEKSLIRPVYDVMLEGYTPI